MKKISLILAAFALVLGISQCRKQETPMGKLVTQDVTFTSSFNNGSKLEPGENDGTLNLTWEVDDIIIVTDDANPANESTLTCTEVSDDGKSGTFTGTITCQENASLTFSYNPIEYLNQDGSLQIYLEGTSPYQKTGIYELEMTMPCAVLKLDLSFFGTTEGTTVTITSGGETLASVAGIKTDSKEVYVAMPVTGTGSKDYTFTGNGKTLTKNWPLAANTFYTKKGTAGDAIAICTFTVDADGTTVEFAPGNLYWNGSSWNFEANQWDYRTCANGPTVIDGNYIQDGTPSANWGQFGWSTSNTTFGMSSSENNFEYSGEFMDWGNNVIGSDAAGTWRTLSHNEWNYLLGYDPERKGQFNDYGRPNAKDLSAWKDFGNVKGYVLLPDGSPTTVMSSITTTADLATFGAVFFPAAGIRAGMTFHNFNEYGDYWSSTSYEGDQPSAYCMSSCSDFVVTYVDYRSLGASVRLVR